MPASVSKSVALSGGHRTAHSTCMTHIPRHNAGPPRRAPHACGFGNAGRLGMMLVEAAGAGIAPASRRPHRPPRRGDHGAKGMATQRTTRVLGVAGSKLTLDGEPFYYQ